VVAGRTSTAAALEYYFEWKMVDEFHEFPRSSTESRRLFVAGSVRGIVRGGDLRESLHARGMNFSDTVLEGCALHFVLDFAIPEGAFKVSSLIRRGPLRSSELAHLGSGIVHHCSGFGS